MKMKSGSLKKKSIKHIHLSARSFRNKIEEPYITKTNNERGNITTDSINT